MSNLNAFYHKTLIQNRAFENNKQNQKNKSFVAEFPSYSTAREKSCSVKECLVQGGISGYVCFSYYYPGRLVCIYFYVLSVMNGSSQGSSMEVFTAGHAVSTPSTVLLGKARHRRCNLPSIKHKKPTCTNSAEL